MDETLDNTALSTIALLEARLLRTEHLLFGASPVPSRPPATPAIATLSDLERRFAHLVSKFRVYAELLKIYNQHPTLFHPTPPSDPRLPPTDLDLDALRSTVLSLATSFPATASALTAATSEPDSPVPDAASSAALASLIPRMKGLETIQLAQEGDIAALRVRSERVLRQWYEERVLQYGEWVTQVEGDLEDVEAGVRRATKRREVGLEV